MRQPLVFKNLYLSKLYPLNNWSTTSQTLVSLRDFVWCTSFSSFIESGGPDPFFPFYYLIGLGSSSGDSSPVTDRRRLWRLVLFTSPFPTYDFS